MSKATNKSKITISKNVYIAICAMQKFQKQMSKEATKVGFSSEYDVDALITYSRHNEIIE